MGPPVTSDFNLDSEGHCFFCLQKLFMRVKQEPKLVETPQFQKYPVHYLARYLEMDMRKVFQDEGQIPSTLLAQVQRSRLKVELCEKCTNLNQSFSKLYQQLEKLELEIKSSLSLIQTQLVDANRSDKDEHRHLTKAIISPMKNELSQIVDVLREEAVQKCSEKLRVLSLPRVKIQKLTRKEIDAELSKRPSNSGITEIEKSIDVMGIIKLELEPTYEDLLSDDDNRNYNMDTQAIFDDDEHASIADSTRSDKSDKNLSNTNSTVIISSAPTPTLTNTGGKRKYSFNPVTKNWKCSDCPVQLTTHGGIIRHYKSVHQKIRYKCVLCDKEFTQRSDYNRHHQSAHVGIRFKCKVCNKLFTDKSNLRRHQRSPKCRKGAG